jgi:hypothetical protein
VGIVTAITSRAQRLVQLYGLRLRILREIAEIEAAMANELAAVNRARTAAETAGVPISRRRDALCGTDGGYYRHRRKHKERACDACKLAHRVAEQVRRERREAESAA